MDKEVLEKVMNNIKKKNKSQFKSGFTDLDIMLEGVDTGSLITIGARPSMGKTAFSMSILVNLLEQKKKCLLFSLEMSKEQYIKRMLAQVAEIDCVRLKTSNLNKKDWEKVAKGFEVLSDYNLTICDDKFSFDDIKQAILENNPEYVVIDYLQLIKYKTKQTRTEALSIIIQELKNLAKENNCIIIINSQLSRAVESRINKRPVLSDIRESGAIEDLSDIVMFIYRDEYYNFYDDEEFYALKKGRSEIIIAKNKMGSMGTIALLFRANIAKFYNPMEQDNVF